MPISLGFWEWGFPKRGDAHITVTPGLERYSLVPGLNKIQCGIREAFDWVRDLTATREAGFAKIWVRMRDWERKRSVRMAMMEVRDAVFSWKGARMRDQPPPPPSFSLFRPYNMDSLGTKIRLVELFKSQLLNPSRPLPPYRWETWYFYQSLMLLGCLRQNTYHRWDICVYARGTSNIKKSGKWTKNVEKNMEQTVQAFKSCYLGLGMCNYVPYVELRSW